MKGQNNIVTDTNYSEMGENKSNDEEIDIEPACKRVKPDVLIEMGLAMLDDDEPSSAGDTQVILASPYGQKQTNLLSSVNEDISSFADPFGEESVTFKRQQSNGHTGEDYFGKLSDEIILSLFRWLPKKTLKRCALVCRRWRSIAYDDELWSRLDLGSKNLAPGSLAHVVKRGVRILRLAQTDIADPVVSPEAFPEDYICRLQFLDLSMAVITESGLTLLLERTRHLIKLSLEHCKINDEVCEAIAKNRQLETLNLSMVYNLTANGLRAILSKCRRLVALNVGWSGLDVEALDTLMSCLPPKLSQLNLSGCRHALSDKHIRLLVKECLKLTELDISDAITLTESSIGRLCQLIYVEHLSISRCYNIFGNDCLNLTKFGGISSLRYLDMFDLLNENQNAIVRRALPKIELNKFIFSSIARPTVGVRRTSIWGLRFQN